MVSASPFAQPQFVSKRSRLTPPEQRVPTTSPLTKCSGTTRPQAATKPWAWTSTRLPKAFTQSGPHRIGRMYKKAMYREYTDATFTTLKPREPRGPVPRAFWGRSCAAQSATPSRSYSRTTATHPYSMHPHGVLYQKDSEGADYNDGTSGVDKEDGGVRSRRDAYLHLANPRSIRPGAERSQLDLLALPLPCRRTARRGLRPVWRNRHYAPRQRHFPTAARRMWTTSSSPCTSRSTRTKAGISTTTFATTPPIPRA